MNAESEGVIASIINQGKEDGIKQGEKNIILELLENHSIEEISVMIHKDVGEIREIIE